MIDKAIIDTEKPMVTFPEEFGGKLIVLVGLWTLRTLATDRALRQSIKELAVDMDKQWDISRIERLDSAAAFLLWQAWGEKLPADLIMRPEQRRLFKYCHDRKILKPRPMLPDFATVLRYGQVPLQGFYQHMRAWLTLFGGLTPDFVYLIRNPRAIPYREISLTIYKAGVSALGVTALVGLLVGISMSYLSSLQLQRFGAEIYIIDLLGLSIIRELGPMLTAILVAGRSGSAMTAEIGIMRVTQELDALAALGISHSLRLVVPKVIALAIALPLLIVWTDVMALIGGMVSAQLTLDIGYQQFLDRLPKAVPIVNFYIGLAKGVTFGMMIAMIACHYGFLIKPNTESLGDGTTHSVVTTITVVILMDAIFSILFKNVGIP